MREAQDIEDEAINTNETSVKRKNKETIEELFDDNLKRVPVGDCDKLFLGFRCSSISRGAMGSNSNPFEWFGTYDEERS